MRQSIILGTMVCLGFLLTACGGGSSTANNTVTISGTLAGSRESDTRQVLSIAEIENYGRPDYSIYDIRCVTLSGTPIAGVGTVAAGGAFSLSMDGAAGSAIGCFVLKHADSSVVASVVFQAETTGIDGTTTREGSYVAGSGGQYEFGTVTLDTTHGLATVEKKNITVPAGAATGANGTWANVKGTWNLTCVNPPAGDTVYSSCNARGGDDKKGPPATIYFDQIDHVTDGAHEHSGFFVWDSEASYTACGSKEGVNLPNGWTSPDASLTAALTFPNLDLTTISAQCNQVPNCNFTASTTDGANTITISGGFNCPLMVGAVVSISNGASVGANVKVTDISFNGPPTLTLSGNVTGTTSSANVTLSNPPVTVCGFACTASTKCSDINANPQHWRPQVGAKGDITNGSNQIANVNADGGNFANIKVGMNVFAPGIPNGTTVSSISGNTITMNNNATQTMSGAFVSFAASFSYSAADCQAMCAAQNIWQQQPTGCKARWNTDWVRSQLVTQAGDLACTTDHCGQNSGQGYITREKEPDARFIGGELIITGNAASTVSHREHDNNQICINPTDHGCTNVQCPNSETVHFNMIQADANHLTADVAIERQLSPSADPRCSQPAPGNYLINDLKPQRFLIQAVRAVPVRTNVASAK